MDVGSLVSLESHVINIIMYIIRLLMNLVLKEIKAVVVGA